MADDSALPRVVVAAFRKGAVKRVNEFADFACSRGVEVTVLVANGQGWRKAPRVDPRAEVFSLRRAENAHPFVWTYTMLLERAPKGVLRRLESRLPGKAGRAARRLRRVHRRTAAKLRKRLFWPVYQPFRPQTLRRLAGRRLDGLNLETADRVLIADNTGVPFGWMLTRRFPDLKVTRGLDRAPYEDLPVLEGADGEPGRTPYVQL